MRTVPDIDVQLRKLDDTIWSKLIPVISDGVNCSELERQNTKALSGCHRGFEKRYQGTNCYVSDR